MLKAIDFTDEELQLFADAYNSFKFIEVTVTTIKSWFESYGVLKSIMSIPHEELPLHIGDLNLIKHPLYSTQSVLSTKTWINNCIAVRLKIGK